MMKVIVPIDNFTIDKKFVLNGHYFFPAGDLDFSEMELERTVEGSQLDSGIVYSGLSLRDLNNMATGLNIDSMSNMTLVLTQVDWPNEGYYGNLREDDETLILKACEQVDRLFDLIRVNYCRVDVPVTNPGLPGLLSNGYSGVILIDPQNSSHYRIAGSRFYGLSMVNGLGLELDSDQIDDLCNDNDFSILLDTSGSYAFVLCKIAVRRLSEAMYIPSINSRFIYLMTTLETIASQEYMGFSEVKPKILPFIANTKHEYHVMSQELKVFSKEIRTEIIHNGKNLTDIRQGYYNKMLLQLQSYIVRFVLGVSSSNCKTKEELEDYRINRLIQLGIN